MPATKRNQVLSEINHYPVPKPYPRKPIGYFPPLPDAGIDFIKVVFYYRGTVLESIWPQLLLALILVAIVKLCEIEGLMFLTDTKVTAIHAVLGSILGFITVFRTNRAYDQYIEGRKLITTIVTNFRTCIMDVYLTEPWDGKTETREKIVDLGEEFRRKVNVLFAFIRQSVREEQEGFCPGSGLGKFDGNTYILDPTRPRLVDNVTEEEHLRYKYMRTSARITVVLTELLAIVHAVLAHSDNKQVLINFNLRLQTVIEAWGGMKRVADMMLPFAYTHVVNLITFIFVYSTPFLYSNHSRGFHASDVVLFAGLIIGISFYGLEATCAKIINPLGWDREDHDFEAFAVALNLDGQEIARAAGVQRPREFMPPEVFEGLPLGMQAVSYQLKEEPYETKADDTTPHVWLSVTDTHTHASSPPRPLPATHQSSSQAPLISHINGGNER